MLRVDGSASLSGTVRIILELSGEEVLRGTRLEAETFADMSSSFGPPPGLVVPVGVAGTVTGVKVDGVEGDAELMEDEAYTVEGEDGVRRVRITGCVPTVRHGDTIKFLGADLSLEPVLAPPSR